MELGKWYAFVTSQKRIHIEKEDYFINLVFYNYILKCFVLIDLKTTKLSHQDVGQWICMFKCMMKLKSKKRYSNLYVNNQLYATKYKTYLPSEEELRKEIERQKFFYHLQNAKNKK